MKFNIRFNKNFFKKLFVFIFLFTYFGLNIQTFAQSYPCGQLSNQTIFCNKSYSEQSWKSSAPSEITAVTNTSTENAANGEIKIECEKQTVTLPTGIWVNIGSSFKDMLGGSGNIDIDKICSEAEANGGYVKLQTIAQNSSFEDGLTTALLNGTGYMYQTPPVEPFRIYAKRTINEVLAKVNIVDTANAQDASTFYFPGMGYNLLKPVQQIWNALRDVAYGFLILIVFFISIMILFRRELNGGDTVTLLNSLPSLVMSMILITFSYAISGLFLDIIPIGSNFVQYVLMGNPGSPGYNSVWNSNLIRTNSNLVFYTGDIGAGQSQASTILNGLKEKYGKDIDVLDPDVVAPGRQAVQIDDEYMSIWQIWGTANPSIFTALRQDGSNFNLVPDGGILNNSGIIQNVASSFGQLVGRNDGGAGSDMIHSAAGILIDLVFSFAALVATFRLFMELLRAYLTLILMPAVSPIIFLFAGIPSLTSNMIGMFVRSMLSSALSFVAVYAVFLIVIILSYENFVHNSTFIPPLLGYTEQANFNVGGGIIKSLAAYGVFLMTPIIPKKIQETLQAGGDSAFGEAISQGTQQGLGYAMMLGNAITTQVKKAVSPKDA